MCTAKEFKKAQSMQGFVDEMEALKLQLPTLTELIDELKNVKKAMDKAIASKNFAEAESLQQKVDTLEEALLNEKSKMPKPPQTPGRVNDARSVSMMSMTPSGNG
jgi:prefoldin subunit 5